MTNPEKSSQKPTEVRGNITVGNITNATGAAIGHGSSATVIQSGLTGEGIAKVFSTLYQCIEVLPSGPAKEDAKDAVQKLEAEARKGEQADEGRVQRWFSFLAETAPDTWEVAVQTFINPIQGVGLVFQKIAARAQEERRAKKTGA
jgi:hypothetical protein